MDSHRDDAELFAHIREMFSQKIPFNRLLGLEVESMSPERVKVSFQMRDDLVGHYTRGILHGGVISAVIDVTGGLSAFVGIQDRMPGETSEAKLARFARVNTIDLRVDFLRAGHGCQFAATAHPLRLGGKIAVTRIELTNDQDALIAVGTGSYVVV